MTSQLDARVSVPPGRLVRMARAAAMEHDALPASGSDSDSESDDGLGGKSLYEILNVEKTASASEIKRAYHKAALRLHRTRTSATRRRSSRRCVGVWRARGRGERKVADETGRTEEVELSGDSFKTSTSTTAACTARTEETDCAFPDVPGERGGAR